MNTDPSKTVNIPSERALPVNAPAPHAALGKLRRVGRIIVGAASVMFSLQLIGILVGPPRWLADWLTVADAPPWDKPQIVVVLGGGGIPSESSLIRTYCAAHYAAGLTGVTFIVSLPADKDPDLNSVGRMRDELVMRGVPAASVQMETHGRQTREEAVNVRAMLGSTALAQRVVVVTSGYHMRRALLAFRAVGFTNVRGLNARSIGAEADVGPWVWLRYTIWANWANEVELMREFLGLAAYKAHGWI